MRHYNKWNLTETQILVSLIQKDRELEQDWKFISSVMKTKSERQCYDKLRMMLNEQFAGSFLANEQTTIRNEQKLDKNFKKSFMNLI